MYQGRYQKPAAKKRSVRRRKFNKYFLVTLSIFLLLGIGCGATIAYIVAQGGTVENSFAPGEVLCQVQDDNSVKNTGNVDAFIRAAVIVNWMDDQGNIRGIAPVQGEGKDYKLTVSEGWDQADDGYYYYSGRVAPGEATAKPVVTVELVGTAPTGFTLTVEILAEAIQADGMGATTAQDAWVAAMTSQVNE